MEAAITTGQLDASAKPFSGGIGKNERDIELAQQLEKNRGQKTEVPNFYAITQEPDRTLLSARAFLASSHAGDREARLLLVVFAVVEKIPEAFFRSNQSLVDPENRA